MKRWVLFGLGYLGMVGCGAKTAGDEPSGRVERSVTSASEAVGLSLLFANGAAPPMVLIGSAKRYLQELDIVESVPTATDQGIQPLILDSPLSSLNWTGVAQVEEIWVPSLDGTFTRERYFRNARWMQQRSTFELVAVNANGQAIGSPWSLNAGLDRLQTPPDDAFVRRFVARQLALGCAGVGDCTGATYLAEALIQVRDALDPDEGAEPVPVAATELRLSWNRLPGTVYSVPVERIPAEDADFQYGFGVTLEHASTPSNGSYYLPGESVSFRVTFRDGDGNRLHPEGQLPTYQDFVTGQSPGGLRYLDLQLLTRLYYSLKHRESNLFTVLSGPTDELRTPQTVVDPNLFFGPQVPFATTAVDGFTAVGQVVPPAGIIFGGFVDPSLWALPVSDLITFSIPSDAEPGTYLAAIKARRDFAGEALNRGDTVDIQVGQSTPTTFTPKTTCVSCHSEERTSFATLLHGVDDQRACFGCHASLGTELDNALDIRVHTIHDRSDRFDADIQDCALCHLTPPDGPQRGVLP